MTTGWKAQASKAPGNGGWLTQNNHRQSDLCLSWTIDPVTGKPVARWAVNRAEPVRSIPLSKAA